MMTQNICLFLPFVKGVAQSAGPFLPFVKGVPEGGGIYLSRYQKKQFTTLRPLNPPPAFASLWRGTSFTKGGKRHALYPAISL
jgi:hypothetical protein